VNSTVNIVPPVSKLLDFSDQVVLVTGASSGIGAGLATHFAEAGAKVAVHYGNNLDGANAVISAIELNDGRVLAFPADVPDGADIEDMFSRVIAELGGLHVLINNAGIYPAANLLDVSLGEWDETVDVNLRGVHLCTQTAARAMVRTKTRGAIVNIAPIEGIQPAALHSHYSAAKAGVIMHTRAAAQQLGEHGIRVNSVSPGLIARDDLENDWPDGVDRYRGRAPLGRLGNPDDVADACLFLASPAARWVTGANLVVDGGVMTAPSY
jgi:NAD(P)-dependent dehydrogenase (short-subunit alcohol dehydrogenase family)